MGRECDKFSDKRRRTGLQNIIRQAGEYLTRRKHYTHTRIDE
jgi:hypothetical protein